MDYDGDGDEDIISGSYTGEIYLFERIDVETLSQGVYLHNKNGDVLFAGISVVPEMFDFDQDDDLDLLIGTRSDGVWVFENIGTRQHPVWPVAGAPLETESGSLLQGSNAHLVDWDQDQKVDIITGSEYGEIKWYRNLSEGVPQFADPQILLKQREFEERTELDGPSGHGMRTKVHVADWNSDGDLDLLVGDVQWLSFKLPPLTDEEKKEKKKFKRIYEKATEEYYKVVDERNSYVGTEGGIPDEILEKMRIADEKYGPISEKWWSFKRTKQKTHGWVWVYLGDSREE